VFGPLLISLISLIANSFLLGSCTSAPNRLDQIALGMGLEKHRLRAQGFELIVYRHRVVQAQGRLHVYLEGDGTPWIGGARVSSDPTPRNPLALRLMALDPAPALYLARPCYNGTVATPPCNPWLWTSGRYSETVVAAMATALRDLIDTQDAKQVTLIGYSGGGVLAWLLAQRIPEVRALVTIAANLDIDRWADRHSFSRLTGSLNPAAGRRMRPAVKQWHFAGRYDQIVPPTLIGEAAWQLGSATRVFIEASDHRCCWLRLWPGILRRLP
jgi:pimeloyl-ACP methyl ester carboxylesterase